MKYDYDFCKPAMFQFIQDAIAGGYRPNLECGEQISWLPLTLTDWGCSCVVRDPYTKQILAEKYQLKIYFFLCDPEAWRSVGKTRQWNQHSEGEYVKRMHWYYEVRSRGRNIEESLATIDKKKEYDERQ